MFFETTDYTGNALYARILHFQIDAFNSMFVASTLRDTQNDPASAHVDIGHSIALYDSVLAKKNGDEELTDFHRAILDNPSVRKLHEEREVHLEETAIREGFERFSRAYAKR